MNLVTGLLGVSAVGALGLAFRAARQSRIEALDAELRRPIEVDEANREKLTEEFPWLDIAQLERLPCMTPFTACPCWTATCWRPWSFKCAQAT